MTADTALLSFPSRRTWDQVLIMKIWKRRENSESPLRWQIGRIPPQWVRMLVEWKAPSGKPSPDESQGPKGFDVTIILWCHYYRQSKIGRGDDVNTVPTESPTVIDAEAPIFCKSFKWSDNIFTLMTIVIHISSLCPISLPMLWCRILTIVTIVRVSPLSKAWTRLALDWLTGKVISNRSLLIFPHSIGENSFENICS